MKKKMIIALILAVTSVLWVWQASAIAETYTWTETDTPYASYGGTASLIQPGQTLEFSGDLANPSSLWISGGNGPLYSYALFYGSAGDPSITPTDIRWWNGLYAAQFYMVMLVQGGFSPGYYPASGSNSAWVFTSGDPSFVNTSDSLFGYFGSSGYSGSSPEPITAVSMGVVAAFLFIARKRKILYRAK